MFEKELNPPYFYDNKYNRKSKFNNDVEIEEEDNDFTDEDIKNYGIDLINFLNENNLNRTHLPPLVSFEKDPHLFDNMTGEWFKNLPR
jgi:hypothetical protein